MKRQRKNRTDCCQEIIQSQHNINKLLDCLKAGKQLKLPEQLNMKFLKITNTQIEERKCEIGKINQMWRYGGCSESVNNKDTELEEKLVKISHWIEQELR